MAERPRTTWKCRWVPRRTRDRVFTVADAARIMCRVVRAGGTRAEIEARYRVVCAGEQRRDRTAAEAAMEAAMVNIQAQDAVNDQTYRMFQLINGLLNAISLLGLVLPQARAFRLVSVAGRTSVQNQMGQIVQQQAANNSTYKILQQAAANERAYRMRAGG